MKSLPCISCDKPCEFFDERCGPDDNIYPWISGTMFESSGNYGSTLWDDSGGLLQLVICDDCLKAKAKQVHVVKIYRQYGYNPKLDSRTDFDTIMREEKFGKYLEDKDD